MSYKLFGTGILYYSLLINDHPMRQPSGSTGTRLSVTPMQTFIPVKFKCYKIMERPYPIPCIFRYSRIIVQFIIKNFTNSAKSVILYSSTIRLKVHLETSSISAVAFQVKPSDLKYSKCFLGISYFRLPVPLWVKVETVHTTTRGSDDSD